MGRGILSGIRLRMRNFIFGGRRIPRGSGAGGDDGGGGACRIPSTDPISDAISAKHEPEAEVYSQHIPFKPAVNQLVELMRITSLGIDSCL